MSQSFIVILIVCVMCTLVISGGYYSMQGGTGGGSKVCTTGEDANGIYKYNDTGDCVFEKCKSGYNLSDGHCVKVEKRIDMGDQDDNAPPPPPVNCVIDGYTQSECMSTETGLAMTGIKGSCGVGTRTLTANIKSPALHGGSCENTTKTEACEVPCPAVCTATDDNYSPSGACMADGKELGDKYCGSGFQTISLDKNTLKEDALAGMPLDEYVEKNWGTCEKTKTKPCNVACEAGKQNVACPKLDESIQATYVTNKDNKPICFNPEYAADVIAGKKKLDKSKGLKAVGIDDVWDGTKVDNTKIPVGKQILFRTGGGQSFEDMVKSGCVNAQLEDCTAPLIKSDCQVSYDEQTMACTRPSKCGEPFIKKLMNKIVKPAFGGGSCTVDTKERTVNCGSEPPCCNVSNASHWRATGACNQSTGKRAMTAVNCSNRGQNAPTKDENCAVNCQGYWGNWGGCNKSCGGGTKSRSWVKTVNPRNGGAACPGTQTTSCNTHPCPVNCAGSWGAWKYQSSQCKNGNWRYTKYRRDFNVSRHPAHGGARCPGPQYKEERGNRCGRGGGGGGPRK